MGSKKYTESNLTFTFSKESSVIKFDDTAFYREYFNNLPESKGVDFINISKNVIALIEVKNCTGDKNNCRWRTVPDNKKKQTASSSYNIEGKDSYDIEFSKKVAMTLAALCGANSWLHKKACVKEFKPTLEVMMNIDFSKLVAKKYAILVLEGDFGSYTRSKEMIMQSLQNSINKKLKWLNFRVSVVDSKTYKKNIFTLE